MNQATINKDVEFGQRHERKLINLLRNKYSDIVKSKDRYCFYDFISVKHKVLIELKTVQKECNYNIRSYRVGYDKYIKFRKSQYRKDGYKFFLFYNIGKNIIYKRLTGINKSDTIIDNRRDRFAEKLKRYIIIKREDFKKFKWQFKNRKDIASIDCYSEMIGLYIDSDDEV